MSVPCRRGPPRASRVRLCRVALRVPWARPREVAHRLEGATYSHSALRALAIVLIF